MTGDTIAILHAGPRSPEFALQANLQRLGCPVELVDVRGEYRPGPFLCALNRVYPSHVFDVGPEVLGRAVDVVLRWTQSDIRVFNGLLAACCDYSKHENATVLSRAGVRTPRTTRLADLVDQGPPMLPMVIKLDAGGYGRECTRIDTENQWLEAVARLSNDRERYVVQPLVRSIRPVDYRVTVMFDRVVAAYCRQLVDGWLGSAERGSEILPREVVPEEILDIALRSTRAIEAQINGVDIVLGVDGPWVIENNPTPGFSSGTWAALPVDPLDYLCRAVIAESRREVVA